MNLSASDKAEAIQLNVSKASVLVAAAYSSSDR